MPRPKNFDKNEVLEKAMNLFWQKGYEATSVKDLVEHTGINKQSLYDTYGDKHSLYLAALNDYRRRCESSFNELFLSNDSVKSILRQMFEGVIEETISDSHRKGCFLNNATVELSSQNEIIGKICADNMKSFEHKFSELIKRGQNTGEISQSLNTENVASFLFATVNGLRAVSKITQDKQKLEEIVNTTLSVLD
jgi:TetR/AcrR family transcriptional regulator, transcriptional repressor for nem operon